MCTPEEPLHEDFRHHDVVKALRRQPVFGDD